MAEAIAWALYFIGVLATATSPLDDSRLALTKPIIITFAAAIAWPLLALIMVVARFIKLMRNG